MIVRLPWPPSELSPNSRIHWRKLAAAKKRYRRVCWAEATMQGACAWTIPDGPLRLSLVFYRRTRRSYDRDNLVAAMKSGIDGLCDALGIDDKRFATLVATVADEVGCFVEVSISEDA